MRNGDTERSPFESMMRSIVAIVILGVVFSSWKFFDETLKFVAGLVPVALGMGALFAPFSFIRTVFGMTGWIYSGIAVVLGLHAFLLFLHSIYNGMIWPLIGEIALSAAGCALTVYFIAFLIRRFERPL